MDKIRRILGGAEGGRPAPTAIIGDEETYSSLRVFGAEDPQHNSWVREYPEDWH